MWLKIFTPQNTDIISQLYAPISIIHKRSIKNEMQAPLGGTRLSHRKSYLPLKIILPFVFPFKEIYLDYKIKTNKSNAA